MTEFHGRNGERAQLEQRLDRARRGESAVLVVRGEAGIGKTAFLRWVADHAPGFRVAHVTGVEAELELAYAGLHQLCAPLIARLAELPTPQRVALEVALGLAAGDPPDRFLVGLAVLSLLSATAEEQPLLCIVDDLPWLDDASANVLGFVARRLLAEPIALVFAVREPSPQRHLTDLPELWLDGLDEGDARALLATVIPGRIDERVRERILAETRGNPLAMLELPRDVSPTEPAGGLGADALSSGVEDEFRRRIAALPDATRRLLQLAAADPVGDPLLVWRAAERLGIDRHAAQLAAEAGLLEIGAQVRFRHPLVRSAAYASAPGFGTAHAARRARRGHGPEPRSRPARLASRAGGGRPRRGRRPRARTLGGARPGARRARRRRRVPGPRGDDHARPRSPRAPAARGGAHPVRRRAARGGAGTARRGRVHRRGRARGRASARTGRLRPAHSSARPPSCCSAARGVPRTA